MSFLRRRRVELPSGKVVEADPPTLECDRCWATYNSSRPFLLDGEPCCRCGGRMRPTEHAERLLRVEAERGLERLQAWLQGMGT